MRTLAAFAMALFGVTPVFSARSAHACTCSTPGVSVWPRPGDVAPLNTRVRVSFPPDTTETVQASLRRKGGTSLEVVPHVMVTSGIRLIELTPCAPLEARTRYEVIVTRPGGRDALVGSFVTGEAEDRTPPVWGGVASGTYAAAAPRSATCGSGEPYASLVLSGETRDDATGTGSLLYAVWTGNEMEKLDWNAPPAMFLRAWGGRLSLGHESRCAPANFVFPGQTGRLRIGVRAVDLAGNQGEPSELLLDLRKGTLPPR